MADRLGVVARVRQAGAIFACTIISLGYMGTAKSETTPESVSALSVTPSVDLVDHQLVEVVASGFDANRPFVIEQCPAHLPVGDCASSRVTYTQSNHEGVIVVRLGVSAVVSSVEFDSVDCRLAEYRCELRLEDGISRAQIAVARLSFDPAASVEEPGTVTLDPNVDLVDGQVVTVRVDRQRPAALMFVYECLTGRSVAGDGCQSYLTTSGRYVDETGRLATQVRIRASFTLPSGEAVDCRSIACAVSVAESPWTDSAVAADLNFDVDAPLAPTPTLTVQPSMDLMPGQSVDVRGAEWFVGDLAFVYQCVHVVEPDLNDCDFGNAELFQADDDGRFEGALTVNAQVHTGDGSPVDCRQRPCDLVAFRADTGDTEFAAEPIYFRPGDPPLPLPPLPNGPPPIVAEPQFAG